MSNPQSQLAQKYLRALRNYLADGREAVLQQAYEMGRTAVSSGAGVLDMAKAHHEALQDVLKPEGFGSVLLDTETFFLETLSPFEVTHRGFRETNSRLQQLNATLARRNLEMAETNRKLALEISERKSTELALRASEGHLRDLFEESRRMEEDLRNLSNQILHVQEEERKRISRELHDEVGQALTAVSVTLAALKHSGKSGPCARDQTLDDTQALLRETMEAVHRFARELRPMILDELGLLPALRSYLKSWSSRTGLRVQFRGNPIAERLGSDQKTALFRIAQESLNNVSKHARASQVDMTIRKARDGVCMEIADNGRSFRPKAGKAGLGDKRLGLLGMKERVRLIDGEFIIKSRSGKGTTVRVVVPFIPANATSPPRWRRLKGNNNEQPGRVRSQRVETRKH